MTSPRDRLAQLLRAAYRLAYGEQEPVSREVMHADYLLSHGVGFVEPAGETPSEAECERIYEACRVPFREVEYDVYPTPAVGRHALIRAILRAAREATP